MDKGLLKPYKFDWHRIQYEDHYHIEYCVTDICNRNCASCSHLAPLARQPNFVSVEEFTRVIKIMRTLIPEAHTFWLTGGEPTLHPEFMRLLKIARKTFTENYVGIYSNGITLKEYESETNFWDLVKDNGIVWAITNYDLNVDYFSDLFSRHDCLNNLTVIQSGKVFTNLTNYSQNQPITKEKYDKCGWEKSKINIRNGKIYNCPSVEFADLFNMYFSANLKITENDYLVVDEQLTRDRIDGFKTSVPFCGQCDLSKRCKKFFKNVQSTKNISEWSDF